MDFHGKSFVGKKITGEGKEVFHAVNPALGSRLEPGFLEATESEIGQALSLAEEAFAVYRQKSPEERARFLERIAGEIQDVGDGLLRRAAEETGLPEARLVSERGRTVGQFRMFAGLIREGSWVEARIDRPLPDRKPLPKPDLRRLLIPLGP